MKFLTFVDIHRNVKHLKALVSRAKEKDIDFIICCGDISDFGRGLRDVLSAFDRIGKKIYVIPGNHEEGLKGWEELLAEYPHWENLHRRAVEREGYFFFGYGGNGFSQFDAEFRKIARRWYGNHQGKKSVLVTHGPPVGTKLDLLGEKHVGQVDYRKFIERIKPKLAISGHLHETAGALDKIGETKLVNPGWEGMVIELK